MMEGGQGGRWGGGTREQCGSNKRGWGGRCGEVAHGGRWGGGLKRSVVKVE